jgi:putative glutamine amidotransferase
MTPRIGISHCAHLADYLEAIRRAGGEPHVIQAASGAPASVLETIDGLLLTGGADVDPALYGEARHSSVEPAEPGRDEFELALVRLAVERDLPVLAICRGVQVLNVALGGSLVQDIPSQTPGTRAHSVADTPITWAHDVWVSKGSRLWQAMQERLNEDAECQVNSRHHQAVNRVAGGFEVSATAPDGLVEAIERPASRFCVGVQWHPENFWRTGEFRCLFEAFVGACERRSGGPR